MTAQLLTAGFRVTRELVSGEEVGGGDLQSICFATLCVLCTTARTVVWGGGGGHWRNLLWSDCSVKRVQLSQFVLSFFTQRHI
jgi:hypothetical protein